MSRTGSSEAGQHPSLDHLFKIGVLDSRSRDKKLSRRARAEAATELLRYRDEGIIRQKGADMVKRTTEPRARVFSGQGILFAVIDDREKLGAGSDIAGRVSTVDVIANAMEAAMDAGHMDSESIARYITTNAFQHVKDRRVRFNSVLKAGDAVGAQIMRKLHNAYNELCQTADDAEDPKEKQSLREEARGFAEALNVVLSPFSCEDPDDPRMVNWDEIDRLTELFEKEQRQVRRERKGAPQ